MAMIDEWELSEFTDRVIADLAAATHTATVVVGLRLGLYRTMADAGPATPAELAALACCDERYMIEWLGAQAAAGYCEYDDETGRYSLSEAQEACLVTPGMADGAVLVGELFRNESLLADAFRTGHGLSWAGAHAGLFHGLVELNELVDCWIPALDGVLHKLIAGGTVATVGCGQEASTQRLAGAFPASRVVGFEAADAGGFPGRYDLVCTLDVLHDLGDPLGAAAHIRSALVPDGTWLLVEPMAGEQLADNLTDVGRYYYAVSALVCTPSARSQPGGWALGAQASEAQLHGLCRRAGFTHFRRATETRLHRVFDIRP